MTDRLKGLYNKFTVTRNDNSEKHANCSYFVIDLEHDKFAIPALQAYKEACSSDYPKLSSDLDSLINQLLQDKDLKEANNE